MIKVTTKYFDNLLKSLAQEKKRIISAAVKANSYCGAQAVRVLKQGLSDRHGKKPSDPEYENSPAGALPYGHTMGLRDSIGFKQLRSGNSIFAEVGSGANRTPIEYAKYLEGRNHDGIRPFLWAIDGVFNPQAIIKKFNEYYEKAKEK